MFIWFLLLTIENHGKPTEKSTPPLGFAMFLACPVLALVILPPGIHVEAKDHGA